MTIAYILGQYPSYSESFIQNEIIELKKKGLNIVVMALKRNKLPDRNGVKFTEQEVMYDVPFFSLSKIMAWLYCLTASKVSCRTIFRAILVKERHSLMHYLRAVRDFSSGAYFAYKIRHIKIDHIHAHFISLPTHIAAIVSDISGIPFSCSAHAHDIFAVDPSRVVQKFTKAKFLVTCTKYNQQYLKALIPPNLASFRVVHVYHGIDLLKWKREKAVCIDKNSIRILTVSRLIEKKGLIYLLDAIAMLTGKGYHIKCDIVGEGPFRKILNNYIKENSMDIAVSLHGALHQEDIKPLYEASNLFILPCTIAEDGDRDGLPNVLLEACAMEIPIISTSVSAIPELIENNYSGLLVREKNAKDIADAVVRLINDPELYNFLAKNGRLKLENEFDNCNSVARLHSLFVNECGR